ncbi:MAG: fatty-acid--CoA ligase [Gemmatimonadetes bacterium]|nr:fatty-acid--CoA ligase [Gemmatimonadota bacterium]
MDGLMMGWQLNLTTMLERARRLHGRREIVSRTPGGMHRYTYKEYVDRVDRLRTALAKLGVKPGDRVATFAWNSYRHFEIYFAAPCMGAVIHTLNVRLFPDQLVYIANHAADKVVCVDATLLPLFQKIRPQLSTIEHVIVIPDDGKPVDPAVGLDYEQLLAESEPAQGYPAIDENSAAAMCYTSGTTGNPKGVVYSHRAIVLHTMVQVGADMMNLRAVDAILAIVPLFHANAWGLPYAGVMTGAKMVWPGPFLQPQDVAELIESEGVSFIGGVPTIIGALYQYLKVNRDQHDVSSLKSIAVGGSACPRSLMEGFRNDFGVWITHAWGMTETTPLGSLCVIKPHLQNLPAEQELQYRLKQGTPAPFVEVRIVNEAGKELPWDGVAFGELQIRGPWIVKGYHNDPRSAECFQDGWFRTGDVSTIDPEGYLQLVDRTKDVVKSGGEWISSVELENAIMMHPGVLEAAVVGIYHPKWEERPLACVVQKPGITLTAGDIIAAIKDRFATWWLPNDVVFIESVPKTSVGKFDKKVLREQFRHHQWTQ